MDTLIKTGRICYAILLATIGISQLVYGAFRPAILPPWPAWAAAPFVAYVTGVTFIATAIALFFSKRGKTIALVLGGVLLAIGVCWQLPYILFVQPHLIRHFGVWANASKGLAFTGGAFVVAGSFAGESGATQTNRLLAILEKIVPFGRVFFSIVMIEFGIDHFLYIDFISTMVPAWIPGHVFWTYLGGVALIGAGAAIILNLWLKPVSLLLAAMLFLWFIMLHIPGAIGNPTIDQGNLVLSAADALAFSGTALLIALTTRPPAVAVFSRLQSRQV